MSDLSPGPWRWYYDREGVRYETRTETGRLIEERDVDSEVPPGDWERGPAGSVSLRGPDGSAGSSMFPDLPAFVIHTVDEPPSAADARLIASSRELFDLLASIEDCCWSDIEAYAGHETLAKTRDLLAYIRGS